MEGLRGVGMRYGTADVLHGVNLRVEPPRLIAWTGRTFGIKADHVYTVEPRDGKTLVRTEESYDGLVSRLFRGPLQKTLDQALAEGLRYLKAEAERRSTS